MSIWSRLRARLARDVEGRRRGEDDAPVDVVGTVTRPTGGVPDPDAPDTYSTTGTTPHGDFVGRVSGDDTGGAGPDGADVRARHGVGPADPGTHPHPQGEPAQPARPKGENPAT
jgi:hypothetical protein